MFFFFTELKLPTYQCLLCQIDSASCNNLLSLPAVSFGTFYKKL